MNKFSDFYNKLDKVENVFAPKVRRPTKKGERVNLHITMDKGEKKVLDEILQSIKEDPETNKYDVGSIAGMIKYAVNYVWFGIDLTKEK